MRLYIPLALVNSNLHLSNLLSTNRQTPTRKQTSDGQVDFFNGVADRDFGCWKTGWVHFSLYENGQMDFTLWRDTRGGAYLPEYAVVVCGRGREEGSCCLFH